MFTGTFLHRQPSRFFDYLTRIGNPSSMPLKTGGNTRKSIRVNQDYLVISRRRGRALSSSQTSSAASKMDSYGFRGKPCWIPSRPAFQRGYAKLGSYPEATTMSWNWYTRKNQMIFDCTNTVTSVLILD